MDAHSGSNVRPAAVSGAFYPGRPSTLSGTVQEMLAQAPERQIAGELLALVVPHAGYQYSGPVAAHAYRLLEGRQVDRVILIGTSHRYGFDTASIYSQGTFEVPTGNFPVDEEFIVKLAARGDLDFASEQAHISEHCLEVQLPFLKEVLGEVKIVPILMGTMNLDYSELLGGALADAIGEEGSLILASTDLSHYHNQRAANALDKLAVDAMLSLSWRDLAQAVEEHRCEMCGASAVATAMIAAEQLGGTRAELLKYATSGDVTGDMFEVVGYTSIAFSR
jgi:AmmeMemoRadiSam system protein B